jgi:hypothetical protein
MWQRATQQRRLGEAMPASHVQILQQCLWLVWLQVDAASEMGCLRWHEKRRWQVEVPPQQQSISDKQLYRRLIPQLQAA